MKKGQDEPRREASEQRAAEEVKEAFKAGTPQDVTSVRAKSSRQGKVTADKWNQ
ncbi:MAG: hypothetical protein ABR521_12620 [Gaiellaceae bacterium]